MSEAAKLKDAVLAWLNRHEWKGHDPFDGLNSPLARPFVEGPLAGAGVSRWARLAILQAVKRSPVDLHGVLRVPPQENGMTWAVGALGARLACERQESYALPLWRRAIERMITLADRETGLWGYPFPWQALAFYLRTNEPNLVISAVCLRALDEAIRSAPVDEAVRASWRGHFDRAVASLVRIFWKGPERFFSYVGHDAVLVHNANLFGAEIAVLSDRPEWVEHGRQAVATTLACQETSGRWSYGTREHHSWSDCFHTAYNLVSLARIHRALDPARDPSARESIARSIRRGLEYYLSHAFTEDGSARYYDNETWPLETHSYAAVLVCLEEMARGGWLPKERARVLSEDLVSALKRDLYLGDGTFAYRRWPRRMVRAVFTRWTQAWIYLGLEAGVSLKTSGSSAP